MINSREFLRALIEEYCVRDFGIRDPAAVEQVCSGWADDESGPAWRFDEMTHRLPGAGRVLDLASGCGTAVLHGLRRGFDMWGLEPDARKQEYVRLRLAELGRLDSWGGRFLSGYGESLPFPPDDFDCVQSYQTLEHVADARAVLGEMVRVTRPGGILLIWCPDYRGTFEPHYKLPWLPLLPMRVARAYLRLLGRPPAGLRGIRYSTGPRLMRALRSLERENPDLELLFVDLRRERFASRMRDLLGFCPPGAFSVYTAYLQIRRLFRQEMEVRLLVRVLSKGFGPA